MIYKSVKGLLLFVLRAPGGPPEPPAGSPASVRIFQASPKYLQYNLAVLALVWGALAFLFGLCFLMVLFSSNVSPSGKLLFFGVMMAFPLLVGLLLYLTIRLEYDMRYYIVTDRSLRIREGVWIIQEVTLTYANVQHLEIRQGPIQQMLEISDLYVRTAGGTGLAMGQQPGTVVGHRGVLRGIDNAEAIRDLINGYLKHYRQAGLGDPEERRARRGRANLWTPAMLERLREIRNELRAWRVGNPSPLITRRD